MVFKTDGVTCSVCEVFTESLLCDVVSACLVNVAHLSARLSCSNTSLVSLENYVVDLLLSLGYFADEDSSCHVGSIVLPHSADVEDYAVTVLALAVISDVMRISSALCISSDRIE